MKKILVLSFCALAMAACSGNKAADSSATYNASTHTVIVDQEFENVTAPKMDYSDVSYEQQLRSSGTFVKGTKGKTSKKTGSK
ncbi:hypothetical protein Dip510_001206 [Elusimicrobium posterum]|uniref:hypothetical protein n=1 Tax=Elusimicrobium posterum TaxID=3116653 RepID=UPI003C70F80B